MDLARLERRQVADELLEVHRAVDTAALQVDEIRAAPFEVAADARVARGQGAAHIQRDVASDLGAGQRAPADDVQVALDARVAYAAEANDAATRALVVAALGRERERAGEVGELEEVGGGAYLAALVDYVPTAANIAYYCRIIKEKALIRRLINTATEIVTRGYDDQSEVAELLDHAQKAIFEISENKLRPAFFPVSTVLKDTIKNIELLYEKKEHVTGVPTGFVDLDEKTAGFQRELEKIRARVTAIEDQLADLS